MDFDGWMLTKNPKYVTTDDTVALRLLRECWNDAQKQQAAEIVTVRRLNLALTKNAMNRPKDCPNCNTWAENEKLRASIDALMLEYYPDEMTEAQMKTWGEHQIPVTDKLGLDGLGGKSVRFDAKDKHIAELEAEAVKLNEVIFALHKEYHIPEVDDCDAPLKHCEVCGSPVLYGTRHHQCGTFAMKMEQQIAALKATLANQTQFIPPEVQADAARYRWLREKGGATWHIVDDPKRPKIATGAHYDAAVDATIAKENKNG